MHKLDPPFTPKKETQTSYQNHEAWHYLYWILPFVQKFMFSSCFIVKENTVKLLNQDQLTNNSWEWYFQCWYFSYLLVHSSLFLQPLISLWLSVRNYTASEARGLLSLSTIWMTMNKASLSSITVSLYFSSQGEKKKLSWVQRIQTTSLTVRAFGGSLCLKWYVDIKQWSTCFLD